MYGVIRMVSYHGQVLNDNSVASKSYYKFGEMSIISVNK